VVVVVVVVVVVTAIGLTPVGIIMLVHTNRTQNTGRNTHNNYKEKIGKLIGSAGRASSLRVIPRHLPYN
jgi:hypothetical protein